MSTSFTELQGVTDREGGTPKTTEDTFKAFHPDTDRHVITRDTTVVYEQSSDHAAVTLTPQFYMKREICFVWKNYLFESLYR